MKFLSKREMEQMSADEFERLMDSKLEDSLHSIDMALHVDEKISEGGDNKKLTAYYRRFLTEAAASVIEYSRMARYLAKTNKSKA